MNQSNNCLISNLNGIKTKRTPIWFMRQAGRYLPEYQALRKKYSLITAMTNADLATEVTLQPLERFDLDAAIIFADILTPFIGMGLGLDFIEGEGPVLSPEIKSKEDLKVLHELDPLTGTAATLQALKNCKSYTEARGQALLGFCGAPYTLSCYLFRKAGPDAAKKFMLNEQKAWQDLQRLLAKSMANYLLAQFEAGAQAVQIFDSNAGTLSPQQYQEFVMPYLVELISQVRSKSNAPILYFAPTASGLLPQQAQLPIKCFSIDWRTSLTHAYSQLGQPSCLQGNLDPEALRVSAARACVETKNILAEARTLPCGHIFNLGHGMLPDIPVAHVAEVVSCVRAVE